MSDILVPVYGGAQKRLRDSGDGTHAELVVANDYWLQATLEEIRSETYGIGQDVQVKPKALKKFGRTVQAAADQLATVMILPTGTYNETFADGNDIDKVSSDAEADAGKTLNYEGHILDGQNRKVFFTDSVTLHATDGRIPVDLPTAGHRATRSNRANGTFASPATDLVGNIYFYRSADTTIDADGIPNTGSAVNLMIAAGKQQSEKMASSLSYQDVGIITGGYLSMRRDGGGNNASAYVDADIEYREVGGVWRPLGLELLLTPEEPSTPLIHQAGPYDWLPPDCDFRAVVDASATVTVGGRIVMQLASVIGA